MKKDLDRGVLIGIALVALLVMFNAAVSFRNTRRVRDDCQLITDTHERLAAIEALRVDRGELESSQRNFIISGDPAPLEAFQRTDGRMRSRFERLHELFADDSEQLARALALENSLTRAQNRLAATIEVRQKEGHEVAQRIVAAGESRRMLEAIDRDFDEISGTTKSLLARRRDATEQAYLTAVVFGGAAAFLGLVAVGMFVWLLRRHERSKSASAAAVYEQREWYRTTLGSIGDAVIATDAQGRVTFLNVVAEALTGWTVQDATGRPLDEVFRIVNETTRAPVENPAFRALHQGIVVGLANHTILIARDGAERPIDDSAAPIRDATGAIGGAVLVFRDVTERKRADDDFVRIAATLRLAVSAADLGAWDWDPVTDTVTLSGRAAEIYDAEPGRPLSREELRSRVHPEDRERVRRAAAKAAAEQEDYDNEYRLDRPDDQPVWLAVRGRGVYDEKGRMTRMLGVVQDVTARKRAESALRESEERQRKLADNLPSGFIYQVVHGADDLRRFNYVSAGVEALCGVTPAAVVADPMNLYGLIVPEDRERVARTEDEAIREARPFDCQLRVNVGGQERWLHCRSAPRFLPEGGAVWDGIAIEITAAKHAEEALRESDRRKDDFIALLAHELRNPLAPIRNGLQLIGLSSDREVLERARQMMGRQMTHLVRLVDDLLDVSRLGRGKMELRRSRVLLPDVIASAIETARPAIDAAAQKLEISLPAEPIGLDADLTRLAQVFSNLLANSAKFTPPGGRIRIDAAAKNGAVEIAVSDDGAGIPPDSLPRIFDMFSQVDRSLERSAGGLGIGLALVKGLVEMHGGSVYAASPGEGKGSVFTVRLPTAAPDGEGERPAERSSSYPARAVTARRVLVVDDHADGAESMTEMLKLLGNEVEAAHDGVEAVERAARFRPDLILMDVGMPRLNGLDATRQIRATDWGREVVIVALTGWGQEHDRARSKAAGCDGHLVKPVMLADLEALMQELRLNRN